MSADGTSASGGISASGFAAAFRRAALLLAWTVAQLVPAAAQDAASASRSELASTSVSIGIDGQYRAGRWTAVRVGMPNAAASPPLALRTVDGDGVQIDYVDPDASAADAPRSLWRYVIPGSPAAPLVITPRQASPTDQPLWSGRFPDDTIPIDQPWVLVFGDPLGLDVMGRNELLGREANVVTTRVDRPEILPDHWVGYDSVDFVLLNGAALPMLTALGDAQRGALVQWVRGGGRMLIALGPSAVDAGGSLRLLNQLVPLSERQPLRTVMFEPSAIESYVSARQPIGPFEGVVLPTAAGRPLLMGRTTNRQSMPLIMHYSVGFGHVIAMAADLDAAPFADWPQRIDLITSMLPGLSGPPPTAGAARRRSDIGYDDLAGQVRATLDRFPAAQTASFSIVALVMLSLLALIGPFDYFLINHWLGRPLLGWLSFPLMVLAFSGLLIAWSTGGPTRPAIRRLEVVDVDATSGTGRGFSWAQIYTPSASRFDVDFAHTDRLGDNLSSPILTAPFGSPGLAFGGLQIAGEDHRLPAYRDQMQQVGPLLGSRLLQIPLPPASSKGVAAWWRFQSSIEAQPGLSVRRGTALQGRLVNPLPVDLLDGVLLFGDWAYLLPTRLRAGGTIEAVETLRQKTFRWHLTHRKAITGSSESEDWNAAMDTDLQRLSEILLFYEAAGGQEYTGLSNRPLRQLDLSSLLADDRAILMGRLDQPATELTVDGPASDFDPGQTVSVARVIVPVQRSAQASGAPAEGSR